MKFLIILAFCWFAASALVLLAFRAVGNINRRIR